MTEQWTFGTEMYNRLAVGAEISNKRHLLKHLSAADVWHAKDS